jgi:hypothetical protein
MASLVVQWKGTDLCADFVCECDAELHVDSYGCYAVKCGVCGRVFEVSMDLKLDPVLEEAVPWTPVVLEPEEDWTVG